jgi:hypothetical protein
MNPRIPFVAAMVGALLVGGATMGGTNASWTSQRDLAASSVSSGQLGYTASIPGGVTLSRVAGATADTTLVLDDTSVGRNLHQRITATVATTPTGVTATVGTTCPGAASVSVDTTPTSADRTLCVRVTSSTTAVSGNVTLTLSSAQHPVAGWTTTPISRSVAVTVNAPVPAPTAPALSCTTAGSGLSWTAVSDVTYAVHRSTAAGGPYSPESTNATSPYVPSLNGQSATYFTATASNAGGTSGPSNIVKIVRDGNRYTCGAPS